MLRCVGDAVQTFCNRESVDHMKNLEACYERPRADHPEEGYECDLGCEVKTTTTTTTTARLEKSAPRIVTTQSPVITTTGRYNFLNNDWELSTFIHILVYLSGMIRPQYASVEYGCTIQQYLSLPEDRISLSERVLTIFLSKTHWIKRVQTEGSTQFWCAKASS